MNIHECHIADLQRLILRNAQASGTPGRSTRLLGRSQCSSKLTIPSSDARIASIRRLPIRSPLGSLPPPAGPAPEPESEPPPAPAAPPGEGVLASLIEPPPPHPATIANKRRHPMRSRDASPFMVHPARNAPLQRRNFESQSPARPHPSSPTRFSTRFCSPTGSPLFDYPPEEKSGEVDRRHRSSRWLHCQLRPQQRKKIQTEAAEKRIRCEWPRTADRSD